MGWKIALTIITNILAVLGYLFLYWTDKQKLIKYSKWLILATLLISVTIWGTFIRDIKESKSTARDYADTKRNFDEIKTQNKTMSEHIQSLLNVKDSLTTRLNEIDNSNQKLTGLLEPFINRARLEYPGWSDQEALQKLASGISKIQPKLVYLGQTTPQRDSISNLFHTVYVFRSNPTTGLTDVQIKIRFDRVFISVIERKSGAFVEEQGTQITPDPDSKGFYYITAYLKEGNDINIEVISKEPLRILSMSLSPQ